jgi:hypothetical protein
MYNVKLYVPLPRSVATDEGQLRGSSNAVRKASPLLAHPHCSCIALDEPQQGGREARSDA